MMHFPPGQIVQFSDNAQIAAYAKSLGIFDQLVGSSGLAHAASSLIHRDHPTHWLCFVCITGMPDGDNGLLLCGFPKSTHTIQQVAAGLHKTLRDIGCADIQIRQ